MSKPQTTFQKLLDDRAQVIIDECNAGYKDGRGFAPGWEKVAAYDELVSEWADQHPEDMKALIEGSAKVLHD